MAALHLIDSDACAVPRLRAIAAVAGATPCALIGTGEDAARAASCGVALAAAFAPPAGSMALGMRALRNALAPLVGRAGTVVAWGARAEEAARGCGWRREPVAEPLPAPVAAEGDRAQLRAGWELDDARPVFLAIASPAASCDSRVVLDVAARVAVLSGPVALVVHPASARIARTQAWSSIAGAEWRLIVDERADDPERLAPAVDIGVAFDRSAAAARAPAGWARWSADLARGVVREPAPGDVSGARVALRAGIPLVVGQSSPAAALLGAAVPECVFAVGDPSAGCRTAARIMADPAVRADVLARQRAAAGVA
jgi:hypothetical protein